MRSYLWILAFIVPLGACGQSAATQPSVEPPQLVRIFIAAPAVHQASREFSGTVRLKREVDLAFNSGGRITSLLVQEGDNVRPGRVLAQLDLTTLRSLSLAADARATRANSRLNRYSELAEKGWVSMAQLEEIEFEAVTARAAAERATFELEQGTIVAKTSGVVLRREAEPGQVVAAGVPVLVVGDQSSGFVLQLAMSDAEIAKVRTGQAATVTLPGLEEDTLTASVTQIGARSDEATGTFRVDLALPSHSGLRSGLIGKARLEFDGQDERSGAVAIPAAAVFGARADEGFVYVFDQESGEIQSRMIAIGSLNDSSLTVLEGLQTGEQVVISGVDRLRDGMVVRTQNSDR